jgi:WD40 repeat protein
VAFSRDGRRVAIGTAGGTVAITTLNGDAEARVLARDLSTQRALAFNPSGTELTALSLEGELRRWSIDAPGSSRVLHQGKLFVATATAAGDGRFVTTGDIGVDLGDPSIRNTTETWLWDVLDGGPPRRVNGTGVAGVVPAEALARVTPCVAGQKEARRDSSGAEDALTFDSDGDVATLSADGTLLVSGSEGRLWLYDLRRSRCTRRELVTRSSDVTAVDVTRDGRRVLAAGSDGTVRVWNATNAKMLASFRPRGMQLADARFSPDGTRILTLPAIDTVAYLWNADGSGAAAGFSGVGEIISGAWLSPDGRWLVTALANGAAALWPLDEQVLLDDLRATNACLEATDRRRYLGEDERTATERFESCRDRRPRSSR